MKIKIAFLMKPTSGIGGGDRKFMIYYQYLNPDYFEKYFLFLDKNNSIINKKEQIYSLPEKEIYNFILSHDIGFLYLAAKISKETENRLKKKVFFVKNINFSENYCADKKTINLIISKTDYYKLKKMHHHLVNSHVVYNPIAVDKWTSLCNKRSQYRQKFANKKFIIGRLARAEPSKWNFIIIKTLKLLDKKKDYDYGFIFAGMPTLYRIALKNILSKKMLQNIIFLPELREDKDIAEFYNAIDLFWQTSYIGESFGNVIAEAFCFKVPVITDYKNFFRKNGIVNKKWYNAQSELVDHGINGAYCNHPDKVIEFLKNKDKNELNEMGKKGLIKTQNNYDAKLAGTTMAKIFYDYLKKEKNIKDTKFEKLRKIPSDKEIDKYENEYLKRLNAEIQLNRIENIKLVNYKIKEKIWNYTEYFYLISRKILRKINLDLEKIK